MLPELDRRRAERGACEWRTRHPDDPHAAAPKRPRLPRRRPRGRTLRATWRADLQNPMAKLCLRERGAGLGLDTGGDAASA